MDTQNDVWKGGEALCPCVMQRRRWFGKGGSLHLAIFGIGGVCSISGGVNSCLKEVEGLSAE